MATRVTQLDDMKRGDTPVFEFDMPEPAVGWDWTGITADFAMTDVDSPTDNSSAAIVRTDQALTTDANNTATLTVQPTVIESNNLTADAEYTVELQLKDNSGANVATAFTGTINVLQDYVI